MSRQLTATIKAQLKANFPNVKFKVSTSRKLREIMWDADLTIEAVRSVVNPLVKINDDYDCHYVRHYTLENAMIVGKAILDHYGEESDGHKIVMTFDNGVLGFDTIDRYAPGAYNSLSWYFDALRKHADTNVLPAGSDDEALETLENQLSDNLETLENQTPSTCLEYSLGQSVIRCHGKDEKTLLGTVTEIKGGMFIVTCLDGIEYCEDDLNILPDTEFNRATYGLSVPQTSVKSEPVPNVIDMFTRKPLQV